MKQIDLSVYLTLQLPDKYRLEVEFNLWNLVLTYDTLFIRFDWRGSMSITCGIVFCWAFNDNDNTMPLLITKIKFKNSLVFQELGKTKPFSWLIWKVCIFIHSMLCGSYRLSWVSFKSYVSLVLYFAICVLFSFCIRTWM